MFVTILYALFVFYMIIRVSFARIYSKVTDDYSELFYEREDQIKQMDSDSWFSLKEQNELPISIELHKVRQKWRNLKRYDENIKKIGGIILAVCSLIGIFMQTSVYFAALPSFILLFNNILGWCEVQLPVGLSDASPALPKRKKI